MLSLVIAVCTALLACSLLWVYPRVRSSMDSEDSRDRLVEKLDALLPQTQCGKCDYEGCRPYARAIANQEVDINRCPPGGQETVNRIAALLGMDQVPRLRGPVLTARDTVAVIDEAECIGCLKCIRVCPVDAIVGAPGQMHTVIEKACTGCELCLPPCPVNCISMNPLQMKIKKWVWAKPQASAGTGL